MLFKTLLALSAFLTTPSLATHYPNALSLINAQPDLTRIAAYIKADPFLVDLYTHARDVTITIPVDSGFPPGTPPPSLTARPLLRAIVSEFVIEGVYPLKSFRQEGEGTGATYANTKLAGPEEYVNTSRGRALAKLFRQAGKPSVELGLGVSANVTQGDLKFNGGLLHKVNQRLGIPVNLTTVGNITVQTEPPIFNEALITLTKLGLLDELAATKDITVFIVDNPAWEKFIGSKVTLGGGLKSLLNYLEYYVIAPGVYVESNFTGIDVETKSGESVRLSGIGRGQPRVNDAKVVRGDIFLTNGVLHILDRAIFPPSGGPVFG